MSQNQSHNVGVIGLGRIAWQMEDDPLRPKPCTHVGGYLDQGCILAAGCDIDKTTRRLFGERYGVENLYDNYQTMLQAHQLDVLSICAYATERHQMLLAALDAGVKRIFCEKALAVSLEEADQMVKAAAEAGAKCVVGHMRRWVPAYQHVVKLLAADYIGRVQSVIVNFSGSLLHTGSHLFDVLNWWFGEPRSVIGRLERDAALDEQSGYRFEDSNLGDSGGYGQIFFDNGVVAYVEGRVKKYFVCQFEIIGDKGRITIGNDGLRVFKPAKSTHMEDFSELTEVEIDEQWMSASDTPWQAAVKSLLSDGDSDATLADARTALEMALAFYVSERQGGREVSLPLAREGLRVPSR